MMRSKLSRRVELLLLAAILLLVASQQYYLFYMGNQFAGVVSSDYWSHVISMRQYDAEQFINFETSWTNIQRQGGEYQFYPPGFPLLVNTLRELSGLDFHEISYYLTFFWPLFCVVIFLLARKATSNPLIALLAAFCGATFISGSNMLGPVFPLASTLGIILLTTVMLALLCISRNLSRIIVMSLLLAAMFMTHRVTIAMWVILIPLISLLPILVVKQRAHFISRFNVPLVTSSILAGFISLIFWFKMPMEDMLRFGGIIDFRVDEWLFGFQLSFQAFLGLVLMGFFLTILVTAYLLGVSSQNNQIETGPLSSPAIPDKIAPVILLAMPAFIGVLIMASAYELIGRFPLTPSSLLDYWGALSAEAYNDIGVSNTKQLLYMWHINLLTLAFFPMAIYFVLNGARRNYMMLSEICVIILLAILLFVSSSIEELKVQRAYLYVAPFIAVASSWAIYAFYKRGKAWRKYFVSSLVVGSVVISFMAIPYITASASNSDIEGIIWLNSNGMAKEPMATEGYSVGIGRGIDVMGLTVYDYTFHNPSEIVVTKLINDDVHATFVSSQLPMLHMKMQDPRTVCVYVNGATEVYVF